MGPLPGRNDVLRYWTGAADRGSRRFNFCRLDGRRKYFLQRGAEKQCGKNSDAARRDHHLSRSWSDDNSGRGEGAQSVFCGTNLNMVPARRDSVEPAASRKDNAWLRRASPYRNKNMNI